MLEDPTKSTASGGVANGALTALPVTAVFNKLYVWSKTGNLRWDNGFQKDTVSIRSTSATGLGVPTNSAYDHLASTQVHFSGVVDAIDRTRAIGAVGWDGERYSYLNLLPIDDDGNPATAPKVAAGLGAWLPASGFSYGSTKNCHTINTIRYTVIPAPAEEAEASDFQVVPVIDSHLLFLEHTATLHCRIVYEGDLPIIAKAAREGQTTCGDMLSLKWSSSNIGGTVVAYHNERFNNDKISAEIKRRP